ASLCGCVGLKPTYGRVSVAGCVPLSWSLDHPGPLTRSVRDAAIVTMAIAGRDPSDPASADRDVPDLLERIEAGPRGVHIGVPRDWVWDECDPEIAGVARGAIEALERAGAEVRELAWPQAAAYAKAASAILAIEARAFHDGAFPGRSMESRSGCNSRGGCGTRPLSYAPRARTRWSAARTPHLRCNASATALSATACAIGSPESKEPRTKITRRATIAAITTRHPHPVTVRR